MSYVRKVLLPGEQIIYETGLHWLVYGRAIVLFVIAAALSVGALYVPHDSQNLANSQNLVFGVAGIVLALAIIAAISAAIHRVTTELAVTDQRVIFKRGIFARYTIEMNRSKVESVDVDQSILGRIMNYGDVTIRGVGEGFEKIQTIASPLAFRSAITTRPAGT
jgi:uncharacterized membrane protein YdbT with pleckstrin-like domain